MPISIQNGMAGAKRIGNFIHYFNTKYSYNIVNITCFNTTQKISVNHSSHFENLNTKDHNALLLPLRFWGLLKKVLV